jgi:hypothetical protein
MEEQQYLINWIIEYSISTQHTVWRFSFYDDIVISLMREEGNSTRHFSRALIR